MARSRISPTYRPIAVVAAALAVLVQGTLLAPSPAAAAGGNVVIDSFTSASAGSGQLSTRTATNESGCSNDNGGTNNSFSSGGGVGTVAMSSCTGGGQSEVELAYSGPALDLTGGGANDELDIDFNSLTNTDPNISGAGMSIGITATDSTAHTSFAGQNPPAGSTVAHYPFDPTQTSGFSTGADLTKITSLVFDFSWPSNDTVSEFEATAAMSQIVANNSNGVTPPPPPVATQLVVTPDHTSVTAGTSDGFTVTAEDSDGNTVTSDNDTVTLGSSDANATGEPASIDLSDGTASGSITFTTAGSQTISAADADAGLTGSSDPISVTPAAATHYVVSLPGTATVGTAVNGTVTARDAFNNTATGYAGTAHFTSSDPNAILPANTTLTNGTRTFSFTFGTKGSRTVTATDTVTSSITGTSAGVTVSAATPTVSLTAQPTSSNLGDSVVLTATVAGVANAPHPTGTIDFTDGGGSFGPACDAAALSTTAGITTATCTTSDIAVGNHTFHAAYSGDTSYTFGNTASLGFSVGKATPTVGLSAAPATSSTLGDPVTITATVTGVSGEPAPSGTIDFTDGGTSISAGCDAAAVSTTAGVTTATCTTSGLTVGDHTLHAAYSGDANYGTGTTAASAYTVDKATPVVTVTANPSAGSTVGDPVTITATVTGVSGGPAPTATVDFTDGGASISAGCDAAAVSTTAGVTTATCTTSSLPAGTDALAAAYSGDSNYTTATGNLNYPVDRVATSIALASSVNPSVFGQPVTVTATTSAGVPGSVQFTVNSTDLGSPVTVAGGQAVSPPLTDSSSDPLAPGSANIGATFTPDDTATFATATQTLTQVTDQASTTTAVTVNPTTLVADVAAVAPGAGTPTGAVTFTIDGSPVGTADLVSGVATLTHTTPTGSAHNVAASYPGDTDFTGSSGSMSRQDPTITATTSSAHPKTSFNWYRAPVTITFTCTTNGAPLTASCPVPATLSANAAAQSVSRTITATDGGTDTVVVSGINIDKVAPNVAARGVKNKAFYDGKAPKLICAARDALSGVASCRITTRTKGTVTRYRLTATDKAGNTKTVTGHYTVEHTFLQGVTIRKRAYDVKVGKSYLFVVAASSRPRYYDATPAFGKHPKPFKPDALLNHAGKHRWTIRVHITKDMAARTYWNIGARTGHTTQIIRLRVS
jgi:hypothetical protein